MFEEFRKSVGENMRERLSSPFYGSFVISWCLWNWKVWYVTIFVDSGLLLQKENILKIDYIVSQYQWDLWWNFVCSISHLIVLPFASAYGVVFWLYIVTHWFYKESLDTEKMNELAKEKKEEELLKAKGARLTAEQVLLQKEQEIQNIKSENLQGKWDAEYEEFKKHAPLFRKFSLIIDVMYKNGGRLHSPNGLDADIKAFSDSNGLIKIKDAGEVIFGERRPEIISLTEKGRHFVKRYSDEKNNVPKN